MRDVGIAYGMGLTAEKVAERWKVSREEQDAFSVTSHRSAIAAQQAGEFDDEIAAYTVTERFPDLATGEVARQNARLSRSTKARAPIRRWKAWRSCARCSPNKGSVTAGNSSQTSDGAGALIVVSEKILKQFNLTPLARFVSFAVRGVPPEIMGIGPKEAIPAALRAAGLEAGRPRLDRAERSVRRAVAGGDSGPWRSIRRRSIRSAARLRSAIRSGATGAIRASTVVHGCAAATASTAW